MLSFFVLSANINARELSVNLIVKILLFTCKQTIIYGNSRKKTPYEWVLNSYGNVRVC